MHALSNNTADSPSLLEYGPEKARGRTHSDNIPRASSYPMGADGGGGAGVPVGLSFLPAKVSINKPRKMTPLMALCKGLASFPSAFVMQPLIFVGVGGRP